MSNAIGMKPDNEQASDITVVMDPRANFFKKLHTITNKIHSTSNIDEIMLDVSKDISALFECDRITLFAVSAGKTAIESKVKTGMNSFKDFALPISEKSIAGYVALTKKTVNIKDVYDEAELKTYAPGLQFLTKVDKRTGYRTMQMLVAPLVSAQTGELLGVIQLINNLAGETFPAMMEDGLKDLCETLSIAFAQRLRPPLVIRSKYDPLVVDAVLSLPELELAKLSARRKQADFEDVLVDEFKIRLEDIGKSLSTFFDVPYEPYRTGRISPIELLKNFWREFVEQNHWVPLEQTPDGVTILTTDPDRTIASRIVTDLFPKVDIKFRVTTGREFRQTLDQFYGVAEDVLPESDGRSEAHVLAIESELIKRVKKTINDAFAEHAADIQIQLRQGVDQTVTRLRDDGSLESIGGEITINFVMDYR